MSLGEKLCALRKQAGLTQGELGAKLNLSAQAISKWEKNSSEPDISTLRRLAEIYDTTVAEIIGETPPEAQETADTKDTPEQENKTQADNEDADNTKSEPALYSLFTQGVDANRKIHAIKILRELLGIGLAEAKNMAETKGSFITGKLTADEASELARRLNNEGIMAECRASLDTDERRELYPEKKPEVPKGIMKKYFIKANIIATIPALVLMIFTFLLGITSVLDVLIDIYVGLMTYALVFQLCYSTFIFEVVMPILTTLLSFDGIFSFIGSLVLLPFKIVILAVMWVVSPVFFIFGLKKRLRCVREDDVSDIPF